MRDRGIFRRSYAARLTALAALVLVAPASAQQPQHQPPQQQQSQQPPQEEESTRAVRLLEQGAAPPAAPPASNNYPPLIPPAPAPTPQASPALPQLVPPAPSPSAGPTSLPPLAPPPRVDPIPTYPEPVPMGPAPNTPAPYDPRPTMPAPTAHAPGAGGAPSAYKMMSLPPVEVRMPPTAAEIGILNSSVKVTNPSDLSIDILPGADIEVGSRVSFRVSTKKPGYLILIDVDAAGKLTQIYPTVFASQIKGRTRTNLLQPGKPVQIPNPQDAAGFEFVASPPFGTAMVVAILSDLPVQTVDLPDIPPSMTGRADALTYLAKVASDLRIPAEGGGRLREARWSFDAKFYAIR